jgi:hypothetical protein
MAGDQDSIQGDSDSLLMRFFNPQSTKRDLVMKRWTTAITAIVKHSGNPIGSLEDMPEEHRSSIKDLRSRILRQDTSGSGDFPFMESMHQQQLQQQLQQQQQSQHQQTSSSNNINNTGNDNNSSTSTSSSTGRKAPAPPVGRSISKIWEEDETTASSRPQSANSNLTAITAAAATASTTAGADAATRSFGAGKSLLQAAVSGSMATATTPSTIKLLPSTSVTAVPADAVVSSSRAAASSHEHGDVSLEGIPSGRGATDLERQQDQGKRQLFELKDDAAKMAKITTTDDASAPSPVMAAKDKQEPGNHDVHSDDDFS